LRSSKLAELSLQRVLKVSEENDYRGLVK